MSLLDAALLGVVQGLTEFLPISSTAHLLIGARLLAFDDPGDVFKIVIQFGSILAIMWLYRAEDLVGRHGPRPGSGRTAVRADAPGGVSARRRRRGTVRRHREERPLREPLPSTPQRSSSAV